MKKLLLFAALAVATIGAWAQEESNVVYNMANETGITGWTCLDNGDTSMSRNKIAIYQFYDDGSWSPLTSIELGTNKRNHAVMWAANKGAGAQNDWAVLNNDLALTEGASYKLTYSYRVHTGKTGTHAFRIGLTSAVPASYDVAADVFTELANHPEVVKPEEPQSVNGVDVYFYSNEVTFTAAAGENHIAVNVLTNDPDNMQGGSTLVVDDIKLELVPGETPTGIEESMNSAEPFSVYDLQGRLVNAHATTLNGMKAGVYVAGGKKYVVK